MIRMELAHHGVKGMKWGVRRAEKARVKAEKKTARLEKLRKKKRTIADKYKPNGVDLKGMPIIKRRGIAGAFTGPKTLNARQVQKLIDQMDMGIKFKSVPKDAYLRRQVSQKILDEMAMYKYKDIEHR